jgi:hypothetical protein
MGAATSAINAASDSYLAPERVKKDDKSASASAERSHWTKQSTDLQDFHRLKTGCSMPLARNEKTEVVVLFLSTWQGTEALRDHRKGDRFLNDDTNRRERREQRDPCPDQIISHRWTRMNTDEKDVEQ